MYSDIVTEHFKNPHNAGEMADADGVGDDSNPVCGDTMRLFIKVSDDRIVKASFLTRGCGAAIAASSMTTDMLRGLSLQDAARITNKDVANALGGLPGSKLHCSVLAEGVIRKALEDYHKRSQS
ncbi:MAG: iron-sulfur cluster assembly scaffold protein [Dehalococcoidia bacterium]|nr:iron-sulfur cluster assembly scaffold protein [Dehalococcoidia bacterium]